MSTEKEEQLYKSVEPTEVPHHRNVEMTDNGALIANPTYEYAVKSEHFQGFLSRQFPTIANPAPLGLCSFALTTFVLSLYNAGGLVSIHTSQGVVCGLALFYGGLVQVLAGMWEFKTGNTFGALAFSSYGGFWMSFAALFIKCFGFLEGYTGPHGVQNLEDCLGIYLLAWCFFSLWMTLAAHRTTLLLFSLFFIVTITFLCLSIGKFTRNSLLQEAGGCFGVIAAFMAWYGAFAALLTKSNSFLILPLGEMDAIYRYFDLLPPLEPSLKTV